MFVYIINLMKKTAEQNIYKNLTGMSISHIKQIKLTFFLAVAKYQL